MSRPLTPERGVRSITSLATTPASMQSGDEGLGPDVEKLQPADSGGNRRIWAPPVSRQQVAGFDSGLGDESPIMPRYLTFQTILPTPSFTTHDSSSQALLPTPPDLTPFICPLEWPLSRKYLLLTLSCIATFLTAYTAGSYAPPVAIMAVDLGSSEIAMVAGITTFCLGFALSPMVLAPLSELYGRYPVFVCAGIVYVVFQAVCAVAPNLAAMLVARFLVGVGGSVFSSVIGGVIADLWINEERNTPMALFSGSVLAGTGAGPLVAAVMVKRLGRSQWKWIFWHQVIIDSVLVIALVCLFKESRGSVLLSRKAKVLNAWYRELEAAGVYGVWLAGDAAESEGEATLSESETQESFSAVTEKFSTVAAPYTPQESQMTLQRIRWLVKEDEERASLTKLISTSVVRPVHLLFTEPVVFFFSLWCAFAWAVLYCTFGSIPLALYRMRHMDVERSGYFFGAMIVGSCIATIVGILQEELLHLPSWRARTSGEGEGDQSRFWRFMRRRFPAEAPESRLYFTCLTATLLPGGLFLFGFTAHPQYHWAAPAIGIGLSTWGIYSIYLATFNYLADIYHKYASSALAAQSCCRNLLGGAFPLFTGALFRNLGEVRAGALLGGIAAGLTVIPWALVFFGEKIRSRSRFAISLEPQR